MNKIASIDIGSYFGGMSNGPNPNGNFVFSNLSDIGNLVSLILKGAFTISGLILLFYFILGGIGMIASAGKNDPKAAEQAKATITSAVVGFVVVFTAYWIVKLLGKLILGVDNII